MRLITLFFILISLSGCSTWWHNDDKEKAVLYLQMGLSQYANEEYPNALKSLLSAEQFDPSNPIIQNSLGLTYFMRERYDLSEKHLRKAVTLEPKYTEARNNLARVLIEEQKYLDAEKELKIVLDDLTYPDYAKAYINLGMAKFNQKKYSEALKTFEKSIELEKDSCLANSYYGRTLFELKDYATAARALDRAISFCQRQLFDEPHYFSALTYYRLGQKSKSVARFEELVKLYPNGKYRDKSTAMLDLIKKGHE